MQQQQVNPFQVIFDAAYRHLGAEAEQFVLACKAILKKQIDEIKQKDEQLAQKDEQLAQKDEQLAQKDEQIEKLSHEDEQAENGVE